MSVKITTVDRFIFAEADFLYIALDPGVDRSYVLANLGVVGVFNLAEMGEVENYYRSCSNEQDYSTVSVEKSNLLMFANLSAYDQTA